MLTKSLSFSQQADSIQTPSLRQITLRVQQVGGINLGQGTCQLPVPPEVLAGAHRALDNGFNRYTSPRGIPSLRNAIAKKLKKHNAIDADPETEIVVTCGTTAGFEGVCSTFLNPGDSVVSFMPYYPYHHNTLLRFGVKTKYVHLSAPDWSINWDEFDRLMSPGVKFLLLNTPANPTGKVFTREELTRIGKVCREREIMLVTDEIYEYMTYDGRTHVSPASLPEMKDITIMIGGYSKTFAITGWRIGFLVAPREIADKMVGLLDNIYVCPPAPLQQGVAEAIETLTERFYADLGAMYAAKRESFSTALAKIGLHVMKPQGAYYMMADFRLLFPSLDSRSFVDRMIDKTKVGAVPADDFVTDPEKHKWVRFCYAVPDEDLEKAVKQLQGLTS